MSNDFQTFIQRVKSAGLARTNKYFVLITPPLGLASSVNVAEISLYCSSAILPGIKLDTSTINYSVGEPRKIPQKISF